MSRVITHPERNRGLNFGIFSAGTLTLTRESLDCGLVLVKQSCALPVPFDFNDYLCNPNPPAKPDPATQEGLETFQPEILYSAFQCSTVGTSVEEISAEARRILSDHLEWHIGGSWFSRLNTLTPVDLSPGVAVSPRCALALVERAVAEGSGGRTSTVYTDPASASVLLNEHVLSRDGQVLRTRLGSTVFIVDTSGVPALGGHSRWLFATDSLPQVYLGDLVWLDEAYPRVTADNTIVSAVEQAFLVADNSCVGVRVAVDPCLCCV